MSPASNRPPIHKASHRLALLCVILLALASIGAGPPHLRSGHSRPLRLSPAAIRALVELKEGPQISASAAVLWDRRSRSVVWAHHPDLPLPMASTTKLMTVWLARQQLSPDDEVVVSPAALVGGSSIGLQAGDRISVRTLLYGALLPSGNDAATQLAIATAGNVPAFVDMMNAQAQAWGLQNTHFVNPHGLDAPDHVSSARDLAILADHVLQDPLLAQIVGTSSMNSDGYALFSTNQLLRTYDGAYGVKTGTTDAAGQVLIAAAKRGPNDVISVVLHSPNRFLETETMLDFYFQHWQWVDIWLPRDPLNSVQTANGGVFFLNVPRRPLLLERWQASQLQYYRALSLGGDSKYAGLLQVWLGEQKLLETPLTFTLWKSPTVVPMVKSPSSAVP